MNLVAHGKTKGIATPMIPTNQKMEISLLSRRLRVLRTKIGSDDVPDWVHRIFEPEEDVATIENLITALQKLTNSHEKQETPETKGNFDPCPMTIPSSSHSSSSNSAVQESQQPEEPSIRAPSPSDQPQLLPNKSRHSLTRRGSIRQTLCGTRLFPM